MKEALSNIVEKIQNNPMIFAIVLASVVAVATAIEMRGRGGEGYLETGLEVIGHLPGLIIVSGVVFAGVLRAVEAFRAYRARRAESVSRMAELESEVARLSRELENRAA